MYESPVKLIYDQMQTKVEGDIYRAIQTYGITVDKDELIRALQYDRNQYDEGFQDGFQKGVKALAEALRSHYPHSYSVLERIAVTERELIGGEPDA